VNTILSFTYKDGWYDQTDGQGFSLTIRASANIEDPNIYADKDSWRASVYSGGSPGYDDSGLLPEPGSVVINEVLAHSHAGLPDWIELYNTTNMPIDISGWYLSDSDAQRAKYRIAPGTVLEPFGYTVFYEDTNFGEFSPDPGRIVGFALSENGDQIYLTSAKNGTLTGYWQEQDFGPSETGVSIGRYYKASTGNYNFVALSAPTPGRPNAYPKVGPIVINEIMYNPASADQKAEYIELLNITDTPVTLFDSVEALPWTFTDGIDFTFPDNPPVTVPPHGYVLIIKDWATFMAAYPDISIGTIVLGPYDGKLSNAGEKIELAKPGDVDEFGIRQYIRIDRVNYSDGSHPQDCPGGIDLWPTTADGGGASLTRIDPRRYGNDPNNWTAAAPTPGR